ncbi:MULTISPECIES: tetratricopeptide repeat protein [Snodgrassella]|uniref:tetratricopeptide repeat protein n=1 Tax=Snodgrassella TaxID=1193515 RepID=UPI000815613E|nr:MULTISPECIES: tetratricopeptide repeat protein [Snodgrassella]SCB76969.1 TPR repeat [Snodgrassella sp. R-53583]
MENNDIDALIKQYRQITRNDGNEKYADAQFGLGFIYDDIKHDYDQAEAYYLNITREDCPEAYANAQFNLGLLYIKIKYDYDKAEACYLNIIRENCPDAYAHAQLNLGNIYSEIKGHYDKAEACYSNIIREDSPEAYAKAQFNLGLLFDEIKGDYDKAEVCYSNITREDSSEIYARAQLCLGLLYHEIKHDYDKAEVCYLNITREDYLDSFTTAQLNLGFLYTDIKPDYAKAEACYSNITREDHPDNYANAQFNLGFFYYNKKHDYDKAEACWINIIREDSPEAYARAQFNLGFIYEYKKNNLVKAIESYSNILESDYQEAYSKAQYQLANIYFFHKNDSNKARDYYNKIKYCSSTSYIYVSTRVISELIDTNSNLISNKEDLKESILANIKNICTSVNDIKNRLLVSFNLNNSPDADTEVKEPERRVAHYTKPAVLFNLLKGDNPSKFRMNIVDFMNDPSENQVLTNWLNITNNSDNEIKSFLASFSFNHNSLNQFRLYGNEDNISGSGVSIAFNQNFFGLDTERSISNEIALVGSIKPIMSIDNKQIKLETIQTENKSNDTLHPLPLYRCLYFDPKTEYMALAKRNKQSFSLEMYSEENKTFDIDAKWENYIEKLEEEKRIKEIRKELKNIKDLMEELLENAVLQKISNLEQLLSLAVLPISCLIKHAAFEDEDECRMIYITHIADDKIVEPQDYQYANSLYVEYTNVENYIDNIYLGPQCKLQHKLWLQNHFKKKLQGKQIKLIKSEMPLR